MLTPQEAEAYVFPKASFGGYSPQQVDAFLDTLIEDYRTLYQENLTLKNKMKLLVDKVEEYRATEDAMRMTLHSAQKMADAMIKDGEAKRDAAIQQAVEEVQAKSEAKRAEMETLEKAVLDRIKSTRDSLTLEETRLQAARTSTGAYLVKLRELYSRELEFIGSLSEMTPGSEVPETQASAPEPEAPAQATPAQEETPANPMGDTRIFDQGEFSRKNETK